MVTNSQHDITSLTKFVEPRLSGDVPNEIRPVFCGASLCALNKKGGGKRPIAVGCTLRRLVTKIAVQRVAAQIITSLSPKNLGFRVPKRAEAAVHAVRRYLLDLNQGDAVIKLDFENALNTLSRNVILRCIHDELPILYPFFHMCYASSSNLLFGDVIIPSDEDIQQGDLFGPLLFALLH